LRNSQVRIPDQFDRWLSPHPAVAMLNAATRQLTAFSDRFGMSPRARVNTNAEMQPELDSFDAFLERGRDKPR
jgi:phage terminase small subunit